MKNISEIITNYITENRISKSALARELGFTASNLGERLKNRNMTVNFVQKISEVLDHNFFIYLAEYNASCKEIEKLNLEITILNREKETLSNILTSISRS